jgi:glycerophosphoryl diester phosphodiesterase
VAPRLGADLSFLDWPGPIPFAHRGGASEAPENTMPAFEQAVRLGYRYVETDVHATTDGVLLAFHDDVLDRVTDRTGVIAELPWAVVREARVDGREPIPLLEDLLTAWPDLRVNIDPKHDAAVAPLARTLQRCNAIDRVCVGSFSDDRLVELRATLGPALCTSLGPVEVAGLVGGELGGGAPGRCVQVPRHVGDTELVDEAFVELAHGLDLGVHVWTIDDADEMSLLLDRGVDGLMTDRPAVLREVLDRRGQWYGTALT